MLVVITSAGIGSRLFPYTKFINKALLPFKNKPSIIKIIESYPKSFKFIITLGYLGSDIKKIVKFSFPNRSIKFVNVDFFDDKKGSLTYTLKKACKYIHEPFFFHSNDSIIIDKTFHLVKDNKIFLTKDKENQQLYRTISVSDKDWNFNEKLTVNQLAKKSKCYSYVGVCFIKEYKSFKEFILSTKTLNGESNYIIEKIKDFKFQFVKEWFDVGNISQFEKNAYEKYFILPKKDQFIYFVNKNVIKFFQNKETVNKICLRSKKNNFFLPKTKKISNNFLYYKFVDGKRFDDQIEISASYVLNKFWNKFWNKKILIKDIDTKKFSINLLNFYKKKTYNRIELYFNITGTKDSKSIINGVQIPKIFELLDNIDWKILTDVKPTYCHGDFHFENLIFSNNKKITSIDPRKDFKSFNDIGDLYYDLSKFLHGIIVDHKIIHNNQFNFKSYLGNKVFISMKKPKCLISKINEFYSFCYEKKLNTYNINIITSLIYLNIAALHHNPYNNFLFYLGKILLFHTINDIGFIEKKIKMDRIFNA